MFMHSLIFIKTGLFLIFISTTLWMHAAACTAPTAIEGQLRAHVTAENYAARANWFAEHRQFSCAADSFRSALKLEPGSAQLSFLLGLTLYSSGDAASAIEPLQNSIQLRPEVLNPHLILGAALEQLQRREESRNQWSAALQIDPHSTVALDGLSKSFLAARDYAPVISLLQNAPHTENLTVDLAQAYAESKNVDAASAILAEGLRLHPSSLALNSAMITILVNQTHFSEATKLAQKNLATHPGNLAAQKIYLHVLVLNDDIELAQPLARKLLARSPHDFDTLYLNGILERESAHYLIAKKHLEEAATLNPTHYNSQYNLGIVLSELNDPQGAREHLEKAIQLGSKEPEVHFKLASVLRTLGEAAKAQEELKIYQVEFKKKADHTLAASKAAQGDKELASGDPHKAVAFFREASQASPENAMMVYKLSVALDRIGDITAERTVLEQVVKLDPDFALAQNQLGYLSSRDGDSAAAEKYFREALRAAPDYTQAWISLAATLGMQSRIPEAREAVAHALLLDPKNPEAIQLNKDLSATQSQQ
jgi:tetratricopeptide (TPR) repeat protein